MSCQQNDIFEESKKEVEEENKKVEERREEIKGALELQVQSLNKIFNSIIYGK